MKKESRQILGITLMSVMIISFVLLSINFVSAQATTTNASITVTFSQFINGISGNFNDFFKDWVSGTGISDNMAKVFLLIMLWLILIMIFSGIFGGYNQLVVNSLALIVSFLATAYITPSEFFAVLQSYSALGLTLASLVPFAVLLGLSYRAATTMRGQVQLIMLQFLGWLFFTLYSLYKLVLYFVVVYNAPSSGPTSLPANLEVILVILGLVALFSFIMVVFNKRIIQAIVKQFNASEMESVKSIAKRSAEYQKIQADAAERLTGKGSHGSP
jgi:hypothetical protein